MSVSTHTTYSKQMQACYCPFNSLICVRTKLPPPTHHVVKGRQRQVPPSNIKTLQSIHVVRLRICNLRHSFSSPPPLPTHLYGSISVDSVEVLVGLVLRQDGCKVLTAGQDHGGEGLDQLMHILAITHVIVVGAVDGVRGVGVCTTCKLHQSRG